MLLSISRSTEKFAPLLGLRSLLVPDTGGGGGVVTRVVVASCGACRGETIQESCEGQGVDDEGCWVSSGRRGSRRRLPPPIPSLAARSTLRRTRTQDGRLVITRAPVTRPGYYIRARRRGGRLIMQLVQRQDFDSLPPPDPCSPAVSAREEGIALQVADDATTAIGEGGLRDDVRTPAVPAVPPPLPAVGCFEDVVKYHSIGGSSLHQMPRLRMVH